MITKGIFKATGAALNVELGFLPDFVKLTNLVTGVVLEWMRDLGPATQGGILRPATFAATTITQAGTDPFAVSAVEGASISVLAAGAGIGLYTPAGVAATVFRRRAEQSAFAAMTAPESLTWTLDTPGSKTGHFSEGLPTGVGLGTRVIFPDGTIAQITALTNDGDGDDEVTLDVAAASGSVQDILYAESHAAVAASNPRNGFTLSASVTSLNTDGNRLLFEAGLYKVG